MKKRGAIITSAVAVVVVALVIFVQPVQSFAANILSALRVQDVHAINISVADIEQLAQSAQALQAMMPADSMDSMDSMDSTDSMSSDGQDPMSALSSQVTPLTGTHQFKAFDFQLPHSLSSQTPELSMIASQTQTLTIKTSELNGMLTAIGATPLPASLDGQTLTVQTPAVAIAEYTDNTLIETQMPVLSGDSSVISAAMDSFLSLPMLTDNLRSQLAAVDLTSGTIYVPVIEGFGQQTAVGNATGYIYTLSDLKTLMGSLPSGLIPSGADGSSIMDELNGYSGDASALIWTNNGVLYVLAGNQSASDLAGIAKSIK